MHAAGRGMFMKVFVTNPVDIKIGSETFQWSVYIAPIDDDMLVGLDLKKKYHKGSVDLFKDELRIKGNVIPLTYGKTNNSSRITKVKVSKTTFLPANAVVMLQYDIIADLGTYIT